jgi:hypothetical protein
MIPDYLFKVMYPGKEIECYDSNGSEQKILKVEGNRVDVEFTFADRDYEIGGDNRVKWDEAVLEVSGCVKQLPVSDPDVVEWVYVIDKINKFEVDGKNKLDRLVPKKKKINMGDIEMRWNKRVVANGWDKLGEEGAELYLQKFGKGISDDKRNAIADFAESKGCKEFANGMRR